MIVLENEWKWNVVESLYKLEKKIEGMFNELHDDVKEIENSNKFIKVENCRLRKMLFDIKRIVQKRRI